MSTTRPVGSCKNVMSDARAFTDYNPNCALNEFVKRKYNIVNSTEYRLFLQRNACKIMGELKQNSEFDNPTGCKCNYNHIPHDFEHDRLYSKQLTPAEAVTHNSQFNKPLCQSQRGIWTNYC